MEHLPGVGEVQPMIGQQQPCPNLDFEQLLQEGDESTWNLDDWDWDPVQLFAEPKGTPNCFACQAFKRHKPSGASAALEGPRDAAATTAAPAAAAGLGQAPRDVMAAAMQQPSLVAPCSYHGQLIQQLQHPPQLGLQGHLLPLQQQQQQQQQEHTAAAGHNAAWAMLGPMQQQLAAPQQQQQQQQQNSSTALPPAIQLPQQQHPQQQGSPQDPSPAPQQQQMAAAAASALAHMGLTLTPDALAAATAAATAAAAVASGSSAGKQTPAGTVQQQHGMGAGGLGDAAQQWAGLDLQSAAALAAAAGSGVGAGATTSAAAGCCPTSHGMPAARPCTAAAGIQGMVWNMNGAHQQQQPLPAGGLLLQPPPPGVAGLHMQVPVGPPGPFLRPAPESSSSSGAAAAAAAAAAAVGTTLAPEASQTGPVSRQMGTAAASAAMGNGSPEGCVGVTLGAEAEVEPEDDRNVCQVPGCGKDLSGLKEYHQRYKICDVHIRLPQVMKNGRLQRFCQQCGRFHDLSAFDGNRKSCREQLQKHNARRRRRAQMEQNMSLVESLTSAVDDKSDAGRLLQGLLANPLQLHALRVLLGVPSHPALPKTGAFPAEHAPTMEVAAEDAAAAAAAAGGAPPAAAAAAGGAVTGTAGLAMAAAAQLAAQGAGAAGGGVPPGAPPAAAAAGVEPASYQVARDIMERSGSFAPSFESDSRVERLTLKLFSMTPQDLPPDLKQQLTGWLSAAPQGLEGYIRPGCVLLSLHLTLTNKCYREAKAQGLSRLLGSLLAPTAHPFWRTASFLVQLFGQMAFVSGGTVKGVSDLSTPAAPAARKLPVLSSVGPLAAAGGGQLRLMLRGRHLMSPDTVVVVKAGGKHLYLGPGRLVSPGSVTRAAPGAGSCAANCGCVSSNPKGKGKAGAAAGEEAGEQVVEVVVGAAPAGPQLVWVEVACRSYHTPPLPLLLVQDEGVVQELQQLQDTSSCRLPPHQVQALLVDTATVLQHMAAGGQAPSAAPGGLALALAGGQGSAAAAAASSAAGVMSHCTIAAKARRLMGLACDMGWVALARSVLPLVNACGPCAEDIVRQINATMAKDGLSLLHRAVRSGCPDLVRGILDWGTARGYTWPVTTPGPLGVTPLHLAALLEDAGKIALMLLDACACPSAFSRTETEDGVTPFHLALQQGHYTVDQVLQELRLLPVIHRVSEHKPLSGWDLLRTQNDAAAAAAAEQEGPGASGTKTSSSSSSSKGGKSTRNSKQLDACLICQSVLPPLLISIMAHCAGCGRRQPCVNPDGTPATTCSGAAAAAGAVAPSAAPTLSGAAAAGGCGGGGAGACQHPGPAAGLPPLPAASGSGKGRGGRGGGKKGAALTASAAAAARVGVAAVLAASDASCTHEHGRVLSVTAMCQTCHANRVLEVV